MALITSNAAVIQIASEAAVCFKSATLNIDLDLKDTQCSASNGFKRSVAGNVAWGGTLNFLEDTASGLTMKDVFLAVKNRALVAFSAAITGGMTITGNVWVTNATGDMPENNDPIGVSVTVVGDDAPTIS